jgi:hypothetical protein
VNPSQARERTAVASAQQANGDAHLAARRPGQELGERHQVGVRSFIEPSTALDELGAEVAEMGDWSAERGHA